MHVIIIAVSCVALLVAVLYVAGKSEGQPGPDKSYAEEGAKRAGRVGLWVAFWPAGLWRSYKHGQRKRDERLAKMIRNGHD